MSHCFRVDTFIHIREQLLYDIGRSDLFIAPVADLEARLDSSLLFPLDKEEEIDDLLDIVELPDFYKRCFTHPYLKKRICI